jgi:myo-inositol 2-dehydrogenase/D-chiro-inositol 1-dehydrogenase
MTVRVGILGAGYIGGLHARILRQDPRVDIVGVADVALERAQHLAAEVGARAVTNLSGLLDLGVQAVYVTTPNTLHTGPVLEALRAGVHVFSEKPMATSLEDAWRIREAARGSRGVYQIGFNRRFAPVYKFIKQLIEAGRLTPLLAQLKHNRGELQEPSWTGDPSVTGGFLYETPVHLFDLSRYFFGDVQEVVGWARQSVYRELDGFVFLFRFRSGVLATLTTVAHATWLSPYERVEIYGPHQLAATEEMDRVSFCPDARAPAESMECSHVPFEERWGYAEEDRLFIDAVLGERPPAVPAEDGYRATELVEACYRAVRTGQPVLLPLPEPAGIP